MTVVLVALAIGKIVALLLLALAVSGAWVYRVEVISEIRGVIDDLAERWHDRRLAMDRIEWSAGRSTYPARVFVRR